MIKNPLVSVLIFAYNHEKYIKETINSVVCQNCSFNFEIIVSDDCSTDSTLACIEELQIKNQNLIRIISNKCNLGLNATFLNAVKNAKGDFIAPLGGDDYWIVEDKLEMQVQLLLADKKIAYVHTEYKSLNEATQKITNHCNKDWSSILMKKTGKDALVEMLCHNWTGYPSASSSCFRKEPLLKGINNHPDVLNYNFAGEGTIIHASMVYYGGVYAFIPVQTTMYRIREKSLSHCETKAEQFDFQKKYYLLRLLTAKTFGLSKKEIYKIRQRGLIELFHTALNLGEIDTFQLVRKKQSVGFLLNFIFFLLNFVVIRYCYKGIRKILHGIKKCLCLLRTLFLDIKQKTYVN